MEWYKLVVAYGAVTTGVVSVAFYAIYYYFRELKCALLWGLSFSFFFLFMTLSIVRTVDLGNLNTSIIWLLNFFGLLTYHFDLLGALSWQRKPFYLSFTIPLFIGVLLVFSYFLFFSESLGARVIISRLYTAFFSIACCVAILYRPRELNIGHKLAAFFLFIHAASSVTSLLVFVMVDASSGVGNGLNDFYHLSTTKLSFMVFPISFLGSGVFYLLGMVLTMLKREQKRAELDDLTSLLNRRGFFRLFKMEYEKQDFGSTKTSMLMLDLDHFKRINDQHGHDCGDFILKKFARQLLKDVRSDDILGRVGGEEFCMVLPGTSKKEATEIAERIRHSVEQNYI